MSEERWYVAQTQPHSELKAVTHLQRQGFTTYLPRYLKRRKHARRVDVVGVPLFPRYLFVQIGLTTQRWRSIFSTVGVSQLICSGDIPTPVPGTVVPSLRAREDASGYIKLERRPLFAPGDRLRVVDGIFGDCLALYDGTADGDRVALLLDMLGRKVRVLVDADSVAAA